MIPPGELTLETFETLDGETIEVDKTDDLLDLFFDNVCLFKLFYFFVIYIDLLYYSNISP